MGVPTQLWDKKKASELVHQKDKKLVLSSFKNQCKEGHDKLRPYVDFKGEDNKLFNMVPTKKNKKKVILQSQDITIYFLLHH